MSDEEISGAVANVRRAAVDQERCRGGGRCQGSRPPVSVAEYTTGSRPTRSPPQSMSRGGNGRVAPGRVWQSCTNLGQRGGNECVRAAY